jgi:hypothetical protein
MAANNLSRQIVAKRQQLRVARPARTHVDPQVETVSRLLGFEPATVKAALSAALAIMLELVSSFGLVALIGTPAKHPLERPQRPLESHREKPTSTKRKTRLGPLATQVAAQESQKVVVDELKRRGGSYSGSIRNLSRLLGLDRTTLHRRLQGLAAAGIVALSCSPRGSSIALA